ncbi:hypothetical protein [Duganella fentianensis]|uniref:hypothetical protein n=1 Tax=Duganella fentianensis TaxID=2692177 RepID=UPI0019271E00|nr:hypothetical protein [Duganella fentianensis]
MRSFIAAVWDKRDRRKKTGPQAGFSIELITSKQLEQQRLEQQQRPKRLEQQLEQQQRPKQQEQQLEQRLEQQLQEQLLELEQQELLLFSSKQPEQQPAGKRSAGTFSWIFLS